MGITRNNNLAPVRAGEAMPWYGYDESPRRNVTRFVRRLAEGIGFGLAVVGGVVLGFAGLAWHHGHNGIPKTGSDRSVGADPTMNANNSSGGTYVSSPLADVQWSIVDASDVSEEIVAQKREAAYRKEKAQQMLDDAKIWLIQDGASGRRRAEHRFKRLRRKWSDTAAGEEATQIQLSGSYFDAAPF